MLFKILTDALIMDALTYVYDALWRTAKSSPTSSAVNANGAGNKESHSNAAQVSLLTCGFLNATQWPGTWKMHPARPGIHKDKRLAA